MFRVTRIMHPTDFSEPAGAAFDLACALARDHGVPLLAVHVLPTPPASAQLAARQQLAVQRGEAIRRLKDLHAPTGVTVEHQTLEGDAAEAILHHAKEQGCDLIVMGTRGRGGVSRLLWGSAAEAVSRRATCPVLTVKPTDLSDEGERAMLRFRSIIHPTDFSDPARAGFDLACSLARDHGAEVIVLHVRPVSTVAGEGGVGVIIPSDEAPDALLEELRHKHPAPDGVIVSHRVVMGDAGAEILEAAREVGADLIVMGTHGRTGLGRLLLGSVAEEVSRGATCPVLTVKDPAVQSDGA